ncbi:MAG TPA: pyridoxamine 5'-phosphate oxidase family protein [Longimicrobiales bacterium]|nr:pyridoxamine 5'-phosphate oxidase family protein [Longimicrobiales bacterium]
MTSPDPFHDGERYVQERTGERKAALRNGPIVGAAIPPGAMVFLAQQRMLAIGSVDDQGTLSATLVFGAPALVASVDGRSVIIDRTRIEANPGDAVWSNLRAGADVGLLAIELGTRRRLRINGIVSSVDDRRIDVTVREAYPNCPKYIQRRTFRDVHEAHAAEPPARASGVSLDEARSRLVERADTLFVASRHPTRGIDISHRGGAPGFVRIVEPDRLRIPDYAGNSMFNTLGNFVVDDRAGLVFLDFDGGSLLQMTGTVTVRFDEVEDPSQPTGGTGRYWHFDLTSWVELPAATRLVWEFLGFSPYNPSAPK